MEEQFYLHWASFLCKEKQGDKRQEWKKALYYIGLQEGSENEEEKVLQFYHQQKSKYHKSSEIFLFLVQKDQTSQIMILY